MIIFCFTKNILYYRVTSDFKQIHQHTINTHKFHTICLNTDWLPYQNTAFPSRIIDKISCLVPLQQPFKTDTVWHTEGLTPLFALFELRELQCVTPLTLIYASSHLVTAGLSGIGSGYSYLCLLGDDWTLRLEWADPDAVNGQPSRCHYLLRNCSLSNYISILDYLSPCNLAKNIILRIQLPHLYCILWKLSTTAKLCKLSGDVFPKNMLQLSLLHYVTISLILSL